MPTIDDLGRLFCDRGQISMPQKVGTEKVRFSATRLRWIGLSQASKPTNPMHTEQEPQDRSNHLELSFCTFGNQISPLFHKGCCISFGHIISGSVFSLLTWSMAAA